MKHKTHWSEQDENLLKTIDKNEIDLYKLSEILNRSVGSVCKKLRLLRGLDLRNHIIGTKRRAVNHYNLMVRRCKANNPKDECYKNIYVEVSKDDFVKWFMSKDFKGCSVDRIDKSKNYTLDNMQVISLAENIRKDKVKEQNGFCECYRCKQVKPVREFAKDKRRSTGHSTICKKCDSERKRRIVAESVKL